MVFEGKPLLFQILIGRLETLLKCLQSGLSQQFQILIGRLETLFLLIHLTTLNKFQILIGRLETMLAATKAGNKFTGFKSL